ncbi:MAG: dioxygenase [Pseudomonadota bacterium]
MNPRIATLTNRIVDAVREIILEEGVTFEEYRKSTQFFLDVAEKGEIPLFQDVFFNATIAQSEDARRQGSASDMEGPYFLDGVPDLPSHGGSMKVLPEDADAERMRIVAAVKDVDGNPVSGAKVYVWHSTADGRYSGIHDGITRDFNRGCVFTDDKGTFSVDSIVPVPYEIPKDGPSGWLLNEIGRHTWRPAHIHFKIEKEGLFGLTTQAYFQGGDYVGDDCCDSCPAGSELIMPAKYDGDVRVVEITFVLDEALAPLAVAAE